MTILMYVAQAGNFEAVRYLLEVQSVRVNDQDRVSLNMHPLAVIFSPIWSPIIRRDTQR